MPACPDSPPPQPVAAEVAAGGGLYLSQAAKRFPSARRGRPVTISCLVRWIADGVKLPGGSRVRLEACRLAGKWVTTEPAIARFLAAQSPAQDPTPAAPRPAAAARRSRSEKAAAILERLGI